MIQSNELFNKIREYDFILIVHPEYAKDYISTKFYEILYSKIPIIYISQSGITSQFLQDTQSGIFLSLDKINTFFANNLLVKQYKYQEFKEIKQFELMYLTQNIVIKHLSTNP